MSYLLESFYNCISKIIYINIKVYYPLFLKNAIILLCLSVRIDYINLIFYYANFYLYFGKNKNFHQFLEHKNYISNKMLSKL